MNALESLEDGVRLLDELLAEPVLEPNIERKDWPEIDSRIHLVQSTLRRQVLDLLTAALDEAGAARTSVGQSVALPLGRAAALMMAAGDAMEGDRLLSRALEIVPEGDLRAELAAGRQDPMAFARVQHARWLQAHGRLGEARTVLRGFAGSTGEEPLRKAARHVLDGPRPVHRAPALMRLNGFGVGLYGERDATPDGTYVATYCLSALWIPILPLTAYRVRKDGNTYAFYTRERLGRVARIWQAVVAAGVVGWLGFLAVQGYLESPSRRSRVGLQEAQALERGGKPAEAMVRYTMTAAQFPDEPAGRAAAEGVLRLAAGSVKEPVTPESVPVVSRVVVAFDRLPAAARTGGPAAYLTGRLTAWSEQVGQSDSRHARAGLAILDLASRVAEGGERTAVDTRREKLRLGLAEALARAGRPVDALREYVQLQGPAAVLPAAEVIKSFGDDDSLWNEAGEDVTVWMARAERVPETKEAVAAARTRLESARASVDATAKVVESGDEATLRDAMGRRPRSQELRVAAAHLLRGQGQAARCVDLISAIAPPGRLTADAQHVLGACLADASDLAQADGVLTGLLDERLAPFQRARKAYAEAADQLEEKLNAAANRGDLPADVTRALEAAPQNERREIFQKWLSETLSKDTRLQSLRGAYLRHRAVVPASLTLGSVKLRRAAEASGTERTALLEGAERAFLSIREEAEGAPSFHLGLGQVLYRLGRTAEGEKELRALLDRKDPQLTLSVALAYRELGLDIRARSIAEELYASAPETEWKQAAALNRATLFLDLDDEEKWLKRCDQSSGYVRTRLLEARAARMMRDGKRAEADQAYAQAAAYYDRAAAHNSAAANNAAIAFLGRYAATGDLAHYRSSAARLEAATRLEPDDAILLGNLAGTLEDLTALVVAERWVRIRDLLLSGTEARSLLTALRNEPLRSQVRDALAKEPSALREIEVTRQEQILAPQKRDPYLRQVRRLRLAGDVAALEKLDRMVHDAAGMESADDAERKAWLSGAKDAQARADAAGVLKRSEERLRRVAASDRHTQAVAYFLHADDVDTFAFYEPSVQSYAPAVDALRKAFALWPEAGFDPELASALLKVAAYRVAETNGALKAALDRDRRGYGFVRILSRALEGPDGAAFAPAIRAQPEMAEVIRLRKISVARRPSLTDWLVARIAGDPALEAAAAAVFAREDTRLLVDIDARLSPEDVDDQADLALFQAHRAPALR